MTESLVEAQDVQVGDAFFNEIGSRFQTVFSVGVSRLLGKAYVQLEVEPMIYDGELVPVFYNFDGHRILRVVRG